MLKVPDGKLLTDLHYSNTTLSTRLLIPLVTLSILCSLLIGGRAFGQSSSAPAVNNPTTSTTPQIHKDFPFQTMWDDAVMASKSSGKPTLAFDLDLIDSMSIPVANEVLHNAEFQEFLKTRFEPALNDFAIDPPMSVGLDSLRNLGQRLSGLEKDYRIVRRPTLIVIAPDGAEMDRITNPQELTVTALESRLEDILAGRNTLSAAIREYWHDTNSAVMEQNLVNMFEERSDYDSVIAHVMHLKTRTGFPDVARRATIRYAYLKLEVEGDVGPTDTLLPELSHHGADSALTYEMLSNLIDHFQKRKLPDSAAIYYDRIMSFTGKRDPDLLNDYSWELANYTKEYARAKSLVDEAILQHPNNADYYDTRALVDGLLSNVDSAIEDETKALGLAHSKEDKADFQEKLGYYRHLKADALTAIADAKQKASGDTQQAADKTKSKRRTTQRRTQRRTTK